MGVKLLVGDCLALMPTLAAASFDACVTDPPYHLTTGKKGGSGPASVNLESPYGRARIGTGFMGKAWDGGDVAFRVETWAAVLRVLKPGAHLVAFGGTRTYHRLTCAIEDAGFEIRDCLSWLYGSGFPKSHNGSWGGTALKPAWEPIILARKPLVGTVADNVAQHGTGALNVDACRVEGADGDGHWSGDDGSDATSRPGFDGGFTKGGTKRAGRWPANVVLDEAAAALLDAQSGEVGGMAPASGPTLTEATEATRAYGARNGLQDPTAFHGDSGGASRFFYTAKAARSEREFGLEGAKRGKKLWSSGEQSPGTFQGPGTDRTSTNHHPTVKPVDLMRWLLRLVVPSHGLVLDPFAGSGTTGVACVAEALGFIGCEIEPDYARIAQARLDAAQPSLFALSEGAPATAGGPEGPADA